MDQGVEVFEMYHSLSTRGFQSDRLEPHTTLRHTQPFTNGISLNRMLSNAGLYLFSFIMVCILVNFDDLLRSEGVYIWHKALNLYEK